MKRLLLLLVLGWIIALTACSGAGAGQVGDHTPVAPAAGLGSLSGSVSSASTFWTGETLYVYAATFNGNSADEGFYVLDTSRAPSAELAADGWFQLKDMTPGKYVLVVGPTAEQGRLVADADGKARIFTVTADEVTDLGELGLKD